MADAELQKKLDSDVPADDDANRLMEAAFKVRQAAYCPYSKFSVGAAVMTADGTIFTGKLKLYVYCVGCLNNFKTVNGSL
jgi:Cytidine and deoxycytidylate deaminase zinc-binding region